MKTRITLLLLIFTLMVKAQITPSLVNNNIANYDIFPQSVAYYNGDIYIPDMENGKIVKTSATIANAPVTTVLSNLQYPTGMKIIGNDLYFLQAFTNTTLSVASGKLSKIDLTQGTPTVVDLISNLQGPTIIDGNSSSSLFITETFWTFPTNNLDDAVFQHTSISKFNISNPVVKTILFQNRPWIDDLKMINSELYWGEWLETTNVGRIMKCNAFAVSPAATLYYNFGTTDLALRLAVDNYFLYILTENAEDLIKSINLSQNPVTAVNIVSTPVIHNSGNVSIGGMITVNNSLYFAATGYVPSAKSLLYKLDTSTLGTQEIVSAKRVNFYPNPVSSTLNFSEELMDIQVSDMSGRTVSSLTEKAVNKMNVEKLPKGNYLLTGKDKKGRSVSQKFIKN